MINFEYANKYCCDDVSLIENYEKAANDPTQTYACHHRRETDLGLSINELIEQGKYFNVPASDLIFLTHSEHARLHNNTRFKDPKERQKQSAAAKKRWEDPKKRQKISDIMQGKLKDCPWMNNGITSVRPKTQEEIDHYLELGYHFGRK